VDFSPFDGAGERIRQIRRRCLLTQAAFAERLGVPQKKISDIERGRTPPNPDLLVAIRLKMGVTIDWILTGEGPEQVSEIENALTLDRSKISQTLRELSSLLREGGLDELLAEEQAAYEKAGRGRLIPLFDIEGDAEFPYDGELPSRTSETHATVSPSLQDPNVFACTLHGDSMEPEFTEGDVLIFSPAAEIHNGDYVCARVSDHSTFRQMFAEDDIIRLAAVNRRYSELRITRGDLRAAFRLMYRISQY
jgi:repressor LexA